MKPKKKKNCYFKTLGEVVDSGLKAEYASPYCVMGLYIPSLLLDAYGFREDRNTVFVKSSINGAQIGKTFDFPSLKDI